jgi:colanic acid biosynthesis glycosyl transferase WcaI
MRILISSLFFHPDFTGIAVYASDFAFHLAEQGHDVTVVTGFSFYPFWKKKERDIGAIFRTEHYKNVRILRGFHYVPAKVTTLRRILSELTFTLFAMLNFLQAGRHDVIVIFTPPSLLGIPAIFFKLLWRARLITNVQDIQTDAAENLDMVALQLPIRLLRWLEDFTFSFSTRVVTLSQGMIRRLHDRLQFSGAEVVFIPNWIDVNSIGRGIECGALRREHPSLADKFLVVYSGNMGIKQGLDVLVNCAAAMSDNPTLHFLMIGDGADRKRIDKLIAEKELVNITRLPFLPGDGYYQMLGDIDVAYIGQKAMLGEVFFPSKLLGIMAMAKPVLISADPSTELSKIVAESNAGLVSSAGDVQGLVANINLLMKKPELCGKLGANGRAKVADFDRPVVLRKFEQLLLEDF